MSKTIIAMGGSGFLDSDDSILDLYVIAQSQKKNPKICLLPTASADSGGVIKHFMNTFESYPCEPSFVSLFSLPKWDIHEHLLEQDIIYVGGGNTRSMLGLWKEWGVDKTLKQAYDKGVLLAGASAGGVCWFEDFITDAIPGNFQRLEGLGLLEGSFAPHYMLQPGRRSNYFKFIVDGKIKPGYGVEDDAALHFVDGKLLRAISTNKFSKVYSVSVDKEKILENPIKTEVVNDEPYLTDYFFATPAFEDYER